MEGYTTQRLGTKLSALGVFQSFHAVAPHKFALELSQVYHNTKTIMWLMRKISNS